MKEENLELRSRIHQQEQTKSKKDKIIRDFQLRMRYPNVETQGLRSNPYVVSSVKRMHKEAFKENEKLRKELKKLQEDVRFTEANELEGEHRAYVEELDRLQELVEKAQNPDKEVPIEDAKAMNARLKEQSALLEKIRSEKNKLLKDIKLQEQEAENYKKSEGSNKAMIESNEREIEILKEKVKSVKREKTDSSDLEKARKARDEAADRVEEKKRKFSGLRNELEEIKESSKFQPVSQSSHKEDAKVSKPSNSIVQELKANIGGTSSEKDLREKLFENFADDEKVSLHGLAKLFTRVPCKLSTENGLKIAEYLIGVKGSNARRLVEEKPLAEVLKGLSALFSDVAQDKSPDSNEVEEESFTEEQVIQTFQNCYHKIKEQLELKQVSIADLFDKDTFHKEVDGVEQTVLRTSDFFKILKERLSLEFDEVERVCLTKIMSAGDESDIIKYEMVQQIASEEAELDFKELDNISLVMLFALSEFMKSHNNSVEEVFADYIYQQDVEIDNEQATVDLINSEDFFKVLEKVGIMVEESEHNSLNAFLCIDPEFPDKFLVNKLKQALEEFKLNEELRAKVFKYYQEMVEEHEVNDSLS